MPIDSLPTPEPGRPVRLSRSFRSSGGDPSGRPERYDACRRGDDVDPLTGLFGGADAGTEESRDAGPQVICSHQENDW
ncbi:hypothetical protein ACOZ4L_11550 [Haloplanus ruber]|uniref:Uncharacterized protein n=1 Tax=Haloplanus ruber TaxID=869892 RepID=A0ABD6CXE2_9EURY|nr:hypothetical protein [Haloplanus ruber]